MRYKVVPVNIAFTCVRQCSFVGREDAEMIYLFDAVLYLVVKWAYGIRRCLDMRRQVLIILAGHRRLCILELRANGFSPLRFGLFLCLLDTVGAVGGVFVFGEGCHWGIYLIIEAGNIGLDLFKLRSDVCVVVGIKVWCGVGAGL